MFSQHGDKVIVRIALMQEDGFPDGAGDLELPGKGAALQVARRKIAKIVESAFTDGDHGSASRASSANVAWDSAVRSAA